MRGESIDEKLGLGGTRPYPNMYSSSSAVTDPAAPSVQMPGVRFIHCAVGPGILARFFDLVGLGLLRHLASVAPFIPVISNVAVRSISLLPNVICDNAISYRYAPTDPISFSLSSTASSLPRVRCGS